MKEGKRRWYLDNQDDLKKKSLDYYYKHREKLLEGRREYYRELNARRKQLMFEIFGNCCVLCGKLFGKLCLHHNDAKAERKTSWHQNIVEAVNHPERFTLLCVKCHCLIHLLIKEPYRIDILLRLLFPVVSEYKERLFKLLSVNIEALH